LGFVVAPAQTTAGEFTSLASSSSSRVTILLRLVYVFLALLDHFRFCSFPIWTIDDYRSSVFLEIERGGKRWEI